MHKELIKNIRSIKQRLGIGVIITLNGTDHHLMNQLDRMEELVNKNFGLADFSNCPVIEEEIYLSINGASRQDIGDSAFHKNKGNNSNKTWSKMVNAQAEKDRKLIIKREELRKEYWQKVENGELRPPTRNEKLISTANGNPDNECVIAARRLLEKKGIDWQQS